MFDRNPSLPASVSKGSPTSQSLSLLATAGGIGAAILLTPVLFGLVETWLADYLARSWGPGSLSSFLTFVMWVIVAVTIYATTKISIIGGLTAAIVSIAARRVP